MEERNDVSSGNDEDGDSQTVWSFAYNFEKLGTTNRHKSRLGRRRIIHQGVKKDTVDTRNTRLKLEQNAAKKWISDPVLESKPTLPYFYKPDKTSHDSEKKGSSIKDKLFSFEKQPEHNHQFCPKTPLKEVDSNCVITNSEPKVDQNGGKENIHQTGNLDAKSIQNLLNNSFIEDKSVLKTLDVSSLSDDQPAFLKTFRNYTIGDSSSSDLGNNSLYMTAHDIHPIDCLSTTQGNQESFFLKTPGKRLTSIPTYCSSPFDPLAGILGDDDDDDSVIGQQIFGNNSSENGNNKLTNKNISMQSSLNFPYKLDNVNRSFSTSSINNVHSQFKVPFHHSNQAELTNDSGYSYKNYQPSSPMKETNDNQPMLAHFISEENRTHPSRVLGTKDFQKGHVQKEDVFHPSWDNKKFVRTERLFQDCMNYSGVEPLKNNQAQDHDSFSRCKPEYPYEISKSGSSSQNNVLKTNYLTDFNSLNSSKDVLSLNNSQGIIQQEMCKLRYNEIQAPNTSTEIYKGIKNQNENILNHSARKNVEQKCSLDTYRKTPSQNCGNSRVIEPTNCLSETCRQNDKLFLKPDRLSKLSHTPSSLHKTEYEVYSTPHRVSTNLDDCKYSSSKNGATWNMKNIAENLPTPLIKCTENNWNFDPDNLTKIPKNRHLETNNISCNDGTATIAVSQQDILPCTNPPQHVLSSRIIQPLNVVNSNQCLDMYQQPQRAFSSNLCQPQIQACSKLQQPLSTLHQENNKIQQNVPQHLSLPYQQSREISYHPAVVQKPSGIENNLCFINNVTYSIISKIGKGGSSQVFKALDPEQNNMVAIKCVDLSNVEEVIATGYLNEIKLLEKLQGCRHVIHMYQYEFDLKTKMLYVVLELGDFDLAMLIKDIKETDNYFLKITVYWRDMVAAVNEIHERGIIHSDLKPANFLCVKSTLKLIDFGISSTQDDKTSVLKEVTTGTYNYMSPETITYSRDMSGYKITYKSDIWSLGCILYNLLYGCTPFSHIKNTFSKLHTIADPKAKVEFPELQGAPSNLVLAMKLCLNKDPQARPTTTELLAIFDWTYFQSHSVVKLISSEELKHTIPSVSAVMQMLKNKP